MTRNSTGPDPDDAYSRLQYRRFVAWPERIEREWPFLSAELARAPEASVVDLGCGTGEHARFLAENGFRAVGLDRSGAQIETARSESAGAPNPLFVEGDMTRLEEHDLGRFGAALCLGNTLVHLTGDDDLERALTSVRGALLEGGRWVIQILNYVKIRRRGIRHLPLNFRETEEGELLFLRLMRAEEEGMVSFLPTTLRVDPGEDPPVRVVTSRKVRLRGWTHEELEPRLLAAGFPRVTLYGSMTGDPFDPDASNDLVLVAVAGGTR